MDLLAAIKREERKLQKELSKLQGQLSGVRGAAKALGDTTEKEVAQVKKRVMSAAARARISLKQQKLGEQNSERRRRNSRRPSYASSPSSTGGNMPR